MTQVITHRQRVPDVARTLELDSSTLRKWIKQYQAELNGITPSGKAILK
ncbi:transposase [Photorhabdus australis]|nr:transposase [Photorhabdus australis]